MPFGDTRKNATLGKNYPDINVIVRGIMKEQRMTQRRLGKLVGWHNTTINQRLKKRTWNIAELLEIGKALNTDLLKYFYPVPAEPMVEEVKLTEALAKITLLEEELRLTKEALKICQAQLEIAVKMGGR